MKKIISCFRIKEKFKWSRPLHQYRLKRWQNRVILKVSLCQMRRIITARSTYLLPTAATGRECCARSRVSGQSDQVTQNWAKKKKLWCHLPDQKRVSRESSRLAGYTRPSSSSIPNLQNELRRAIQLILSQTKVKRRRKRKARGLTRLMKMRRMKLGKKSSRRRESRRRRSRLRRKRLKATFMAHSKYLRKLRKLTKRWLRKHIARWHWSTIRTSWVKI